ncbi:MAG: hypothetical protein ACYCO3_03690 [Mycobacteriales bacterium]
MTPCRLREEELLYVLGGRAVSDAEKAARVDGQRRETEQLVNQDAE